MKLYGVVVNLPQSAQDEGEPAQRFFAVWARDDNQAYAMVTDSLDYSLISATTMPLEHLMANFDGCVEIGGY
jgi:hypothetical protein